MKKITLVIPCYNEQGRIPLMKAALVEFDSAWGHAYELIAVNDGSKDNTLKLLHDTLVGQFANAEVKIVDSGENFGKGHALKLGVTQSSGDFVLTLDADMATNPIELLNWLKSRKGQFFSEQEILVGSREHRNSQVKAPWVRQFLGNAFNTFIRFTTPVNLRDTQCGFKLYPGTIGRKLFSTLQVNGWAHDIEILYKAKLHGYSIIPMAIDWQHVEDEKINVYKDGIVMVFQSLMISMRIKLDWYILRNRPANAIKEPQKRISTIEND